MAEARADEAAEREPGETRPAGPPAPVRIEPPRARAPRTGAVALRYERGETAAREVVAKGRGEVAEAILALAREHGVPVREDRDLLELLSACELGDEVPQELYAAVAEVLAFLYRVNGELAG